MNREKNKGENYKEKQPGKMFAQDVNTNGKRGGRQVKRGKEIVF